MTLHYQRVAVRHNAAYALPVLSYVPAPEDHMGYSEVHQQPDAQATGTSQGDLHVIYSPPGGAPRSVQPTGVQVGAPSAATASTAYAFRPASLPEQSGSPSGARPPGSGAVATAPPFQRGITPPANQSRTVSTGSSLPHSGEPAAHGTAGGLPPPPSYGSATAPQTRLTVPPSRGQAVAYQANDDGLPTYQDAVLGRT